MSNREQWLTRCAQEIVGHYFTTNGIALENFKVTCGWPSSGGRAMKRRTLGQCFHAEASSADIYEIFISPTLADNVDVAAVLAHELCHVADKCENGHRAPFTKLARMCELEGKPTATVAGEAFKQWIETRTATLGDYPHAEITVNPKHKKQTTRMHKVTCANDECGMVFRTSAKWIDANPDLSCPACAAPCRIA